MATSAIRYANGNTVEVQVTSTIAEGDLAFIDNWLGFVPHTQVSGEKTALNIEYAEFDIVLPSSLGLTKGDEVFVDVTDLTDHIPDDTAYYTATGANRRRLGRCVTEQDGTSGQVRIQSALRAQ